MERAGIGRLVAALVPAQHRPAVAAGIEEGIEHPVFVARDKDRLTTHLQGDVVVVLRDLAFMGQVQPVAFKNVLHFKVEQARVGEHLTLAAEAAFITVFFKQGIEILDAYGHGLSLRCCYGVLAVSTTCAPGNIRYLQTAIRFVQSGTPAIGVLPRRARRSVARMLQGLDL